MPDYSLSLHFMHPRYGTVFQAELAWEYTVAEVLDLLQGSGFILRREPGAYRLAFYDRELPQHLHLQDIEDLQDGDILRVVVDVYEPKELELGAEPTAQEEELAPPSLALFLQLPDFGLLPWQLPLATTAQALIQELQHLGLLGPEMQGAWLRPDGRTWAAEESAKEAGLKAQSLLRFMPSNPGEAQPSFQDLYQALDQHIEALEERLSTQLGIIRDKIPKPYTIPLDVHHALLNPTQSPYISIEQMIGERRRNSGLKPLPKITVPWGGWPWLLLSLLALIGLGTALALNTNLF